MKQTKKLTRNQKEFLERKCRIDHVGVRLIEETKDFLKVQLMSGCIKTYDRTTAKEIASESYS